MHAPERLVRAEDESHTIHGVTQAGRIGASVEDMTEVTAALATKDLGARHAQRTFVALDDGVVEGLVETGPAGATVELGCR